MTATKRVSKAKRTDKAITVEAEVKQGGCGVPGCTACGNRIRYVYPTWGGEWMGEPNRRPAGKDDQVLEIKKAYRTATHVGDDKVCRDHMALLTYGQIKKEGMSRAIELVRRSYAYKEKVTQEIIEWFIETVDRNWAPPRKPLAQYLAECLKEELGGVQAPTTVQGWAMVLQLGIQAYEKERKIKTVYDGFNEKGITNGKEEEGRAKATQEG